MMKWDLRTVISDRPLAPPRPLLSILVGKFQSFATPRAGSFSCASMGLWGRRDIPARPGHPLKDPVPVSSTPGTEFPTSDSISKHEPSPFRHRFRELTLGHAYSVERLLGELTV